MVPGDGPTIVLINGAGGPTEGWHRLFPEISTLGTVFAYDRPGVGGSARPTRPQTGRVVVKALRALLRGQGLLPPYILVAHSFGGLHANLFARLHPDEVAGVVLIEPASADDVTAQKALQTGAQRLINGLLNRLSPPDPNGEVAQELETVRELREAGPFPDVPLCVIVGGRPPQSWQTRPEAQASRQTNLHALSRMSHRGSLTVAEHSGHFPQMSQPAVVLDAIRRMISQAAA
jgi:pimeloyl-ACP methyl ester carboxylesterase